MKPSTECFGTIAAPMASRTRNAAKTAQPCQVTGRPQPQPYRFAGNQYWTLWRMLNPRAFLRKDALAMEAGETVPQRTPSHAAASCLAESRAIAFEQWRRSFLASWPGHGLAAGPAMTEQMCRSALSATVILLVLPVVALIRRLPVVVAAAIGAGAAVIAAIRAVVVLVGAGPHAAAGHLLVERLGSGAQPVPRRAQALLVLLQLLVAFVAVLPLALVIGLLIGVLIVLLRRVALAVERPADILKHISEIAAALILLGQRGRCQQRACHHRDRQSVHVAPPF